MSNTGSKGFNLWIFAVVAVVVVALWLGYWQWIISCFKDWNHRGQFGDMFGGLNALFSGLAFAGVICTILLQGQELKLQREELREQRIATQDSAKALAKQVEAMGVASKINVLTAHIQAQSSQEATRSIKGYTPELLALIAEARKLVNLDLT